MNKETSYYCDQIILN